MPWGTSMLLTGEMRRTRKGEGEANEAGGKSGECGVLGRPKGKNTFFFF